MMEEDPFPDLHISDSSFLDDLEGRQKCPVCERSRKFFCYSCCVPVAGTENRIPRLQLPIKIDIIKHPREVDGKSTSSHAAIIAPGEVTVYTYPVIPQYDDKVVLVFPGKSSLTMTEYAEKFSGEQSQKAFNRTTSNGTASESSTQCLSSTKESSPGTVAQRDLQGMHDICNISDNPTGTASGTLYQPAFNRVVFIDSTWYQAHQIYSDDRLTILPRIELKSQISHFWRYHKGKPATYLSTVEAVYYFVREYHDLYVGGEYRGQYDDLLFYFMFFYHKIREQYEGNKVLKAYEQLATSVNSMVVSEISQSEADPQSS